MQQAIVVGLVCRQWRQAAAEAVQALELTLQVKPSTAAGVLSPVLAELVNGRCCLNLEHPLLADPSVLRFLDQARVPALSLGAHQAASAEVRAILEQCEYVRTLSCRTGPLPSWPPGLDTLTVQLRDGATPSKARQLLCSLSGQPRLACLHLHWFGGGAVVLGEPASFQGFPALRELHLDLDTVPNSACFSLSALAGHAARGVSVYLSIVLFWAQKARQTVWAALAQCPQLHALHLRIQCLPSDEAPSFQEQQLLASVACRQLVLRFDFGVALVSGRRPIVWSDRLLALCRISSNQLLCEVRFGLHDKVPISWPVLVAQPGIFVLSGGKNLYILGCSGPPDFAQSWALLLREQTSVEGVPMHDLERGPGGHPTWRNSHITASRLDEAYKQLHLDVFNSMRR